MDRFKETIVMQPTVQPSATVPPTLLERHPLDAEGPWPIDWRVGAAASGEPGGDAGWVAVRVEPYEVLPPVADRETAVALAAVRARREGVTVWTWHAPAAWTQWDAWR